MPIQIWAITHVMMVLLAWTGPSGGRGVMLLENLDVGLGHPSET